MLLIVPMSVFVAFELRGNFYFKKITSVEIKRSFNSNSK